MAAVIAAAELRRRIVARGEIALLDAREEASFWESHLLLASCLPLSRLELLASAMLPRKGVPIVVMDNGEGLAERAANRLAEGGWRDLAVLDGGVAAWGAAGFPLYSGVHVPSKAFAEAVEHECETPSISAEELAERQRRGDDLKIFDSRSFEEYHSNSIPGATSVPGAELVYRFADLVPSAETFVVVNCGGRTRSIIGAQALIEAGVPNKVVSLKNGTMAWHLAGLGVVNGATARAPAVSEKGLRLARQRAEAVARRYGVPTIGRGLLAQWQDEAEERTLYLLDVRDPAEYRGGHLPGSLSAPGGQLVQETDSWLAVWGARVVLVDDTGVRARMTASWLKRMGWDAVVLDGGLEGARLEEGMPAADFSDFPLAGPAPAEIEPRALDPKSAIVVDLALSKHHRAGHVPGAHFAIRARLGEALAQLPPGSNIVLTSEDGALARFAAAEAGPKVAVLKGGTDAWRAAGLALEEGMGRLLSQPDDVALSARDRPPEERERRMREYLDWEVDLVNQIARDADCRFTLSPVTGVSAD
ncbi:MAG TPA: rhodanese-like domain-containing protein [Stellaceae bacterium]|nr:rhodanese-like domain-containing protein [Stellaceae bacterium]